MTVKQMRSLLKGLPADMGIMMEIGGETLISVCFENSEVVEVDVAIDLDEEDESTETRLLLLLVPCSCSIEKEVQIEEPNLN